MRRGYKILVGTVVLISASILFFFGASDNATELQKTVKITQESAVPTFEIEEEKEEERTASASVSVPAETKEEQTEAVSDRATPTPVAESAEPSIEIKQEEKTGDCCCFMCCCPCSRPRFCWFQTLLLCPGWK